MRGKHKVTGATGGRKFATGSAAGCPKMCKWDAKTTYHKGDQVFYNNRLYEARLDETVEIGATNLGQPPGSVFVEGVKVEFDSLFPWANMTGVHHITFEGTPIADGQLTFECSTWYGHSTAKDITINVTAGMPASAIAAELAQELNGAQTFTALSFTYTAVGNKLVVDTDNSILVTNAMYIGRITPKAEHLQALNLNANAIPYWQELGATTKVLHTDHIALPAGGSAYNTQFDVTLDAGCLLKIESNLSIAYDNDSDYTNMKLEIDGRQVAFTNTSTHASFYQAGCFLLWTTQFQGLHHAKLTLDRSSGVEVKDWTILVTEIPV